MNFGNKSLLFIIALLIIFSLTQSKGKISRIDQSNFDKFSQDGSYWIIQISQNNCPECQKHQTELIQTAQLLQGVCKVGKVDAKFLKGMKISQNPTYLFLRSDKIQDNVQFKQTKISKVAFAKFCLQQVEKAVKKRHKTLFGGSQNNREAGDAKKPSNKGPTGQRIVDVTDKDFQKLVIQSKQAWFVLFYSPGCGHCRSLQPQYEKLPGLIGKKVIIARIDATKNSAMAQKYQIRGYPTMLLFEVDGKQKPIPYEGQRTAQQIKSWLQTKKLSKSVKQLHQLSKKSYEWNCNRNIVCLIFILESKSDKNLLKFIKPLLEQTIEKPIQFFYSERLPILESYLMIDDRSSPKMVATWEGINSYRTYNGANNYESLKQFIEHIMQRKKWIKFQQKSIDLMFSNENSQQL